MTSPRTEINFKVSDLTKKFSRKTIFQNISFTLSAGSSLAITGKNGSGKSTLIKILARVLEKTSGEVDLSLNNAPVNIEKYCSYIGFVSPYLSLYDEFTGYENLRIVSDIRGFDAANIDDILKRVGLYERRNDLLKIYSSGMKQRLKIAFAVMHNPYVLLLDEPTSNLDSDGIKIVDEISDEYKKNKVLIIATNDEHEKSLCRNEINLNEINLKANV